VDPMLATAGPLPRGEDWAYELKWDGERVLADLAAGVLTLSARSGTDITAAYPELAPLARAVPDAFLDGGVVVLVDGRPSAGALRERRHARSAGQARRLARARPATYLVFDVLRLYGVDLYDRPYAERRATLGRLGLSGPRWAVPPAFDDGPGTLAASREHGLDGVVAKRLASPYRPGLRSPDWVEVGLRPLTPTTGQSPR